MEYIDSFISFVSQMISCLWNLEKNDQELMFLEHLQTVSLFKLFFLRVLVLFLCHCSCILFKPFPPRAFQKGVLK